MQTARAPVAAGELHRSFAAKGAAQDDKTTTNTRDLSIAIRHEQSSLSLLGRRPTTNDTFQDASATSYQRLDKTGSHLGIRLAQL